MHRRLARGLEGTGSTGERNESRATSDDIQNDGRQRESGTRRQMEVNKDERMIKTEMSRKKRRGETKKKSK